MRKHSLPPAIAALFRPVQPVGFFASLTCLLGNLASGADFTPTQLEFFEKEVRPLFAEHCYKCHSVDAKRLEAGLLLDSRASQLRGGDSGPAIVPGKADQSLLIQAVRYEDFEMPPKGKLPAKDVATLVRWIQMGAPWPSEAEPVAAGERSSFDLEKRAAEFWIWQPVTAPEQPTVQDSSWPKNEIDHHILAGVEAAGLRPAGDADRAALLRRLHFDLIGLPPTPGEIRTFLADPSSKAIERAVDRLLDSPHFGERWGRHWLDSVRYAESRGHEFDNDTPNAFQYRDYVIRALNADVPYDQFVREHIAGDLLPKPRLHPEKKFNESVLGTGYWFLGEWVHSPVDIRKDESDRFDNMLDVMSKTFLGVTVACARCHDHKFDAISTADYYSLSGFLQSSDYRQVRFESMEQNGQVAADLAEVDTRFQREIGELLKRHGLHRPPAAKPIAGEGIVFNYASIPASDYLQDGYIFGQTPRRAGQPYLDGPVVKVARFGAAVNDPIWFGLNAVHEGVMQNRSALAKLPKSGRTLRTPTFELTDGNVACLVKGTGHVVACVDSHRLVAGPLHKQTIKSIGGRSGWVTLNLKRYVGHRLHLEFVPAKNVSLSVRLVTQGLDATELREIDRRLALAAREVEQYAAAAEALLNGGGVPGGAMEERVFADFESGTYDGWTVEGDAFGKVPQSQATIGKYQGNVQAVGKYFVNSHNIRGEGRDMRRGDGFTGTLTSPEFTIDFDTVEFLVGGGSHRTKTCVNLIVDGQAVLTATGKRRNQMSLNTWDVRQYRGKTAKIRVVDNHTGGWGNIGLDHIVFKGRRQAPQPAVKGAPAQRLIRGWQAERQRLGKQIIRKSRVALAMMDGSGEDDRILIRGNSSKPGKVEPRHFLTAISGNNPPAIKSGSGRLELAEHINDPANPLTSRVIVNRIWHHLMGRGIVPTVDDFGVLGQRPSHPKLLDHLATRFLADGRSIKGMIKYIVRSRTYQMSSHSHPQAMESDPKNVLWHHQPPRRLQGEVIRDALLALSGRLNRAAFGPPVPIHLTSFMDGRGRPGRNGPLDGNGRRSIYIAVRRNFLSPFMLTFDTPVPFSSMGRRNVSNVPAQSLILLNDPLVVELSRGWAERALKAEPHDVAKRIAWLYLTGFGRQPTVGESRIAVDFIDSKAAELQVSTGDSKLWADFAHVLVNTKEFIFLR